MLQRIELGLATPPDEVTILHLSDLHLLSSHHVSGKQKEGFLSQLADSLRKLIDAGESFDLMVVTGDLIDNRELTISGRREALDKAKTLLSELAELLFADRELARRVRVIPGNHDHSWRGSTRSLDSVEDFDRHFGTLGQHALYPELDLLVACFDSNFDLAPLDTALGKVDMRRFDRLNDELRELLRADPELASRQQRLRRLALVHHHPLPVAEAEAPRRLSRWEKLIGKQVEGAAEFLLLKNSGSFLRRLMAEDFRLVLHGHLHKRGYWRPLTYQEGKNRWLEVIACGATGLPAEGNAEHSFNVVKLHRDGFVECKHVGFSSGGLRSDPVSFATASYDVVREELWDRRPLSKRARVRCNAYSKLWDVVFPEGDLITTEVLRGVRADEDGVDKLRLYTSSKALTLIEFEARALSGEVAVTGEQTLTAVDGTPRQEYLLTFQPALDRKTQPIDILIRRRAFGVLLPSREAKQRWGYAADELEEDECRQAVSIPCTRLQVRLRMSSPTWVPEQVRLRVEDERREPAPREQLSEKVMMTSWPRHVSGTPQEPMLETEALLTVIRPQTGYFYSLWWRLPDTDPMEDAPQVLGRRLQLLNIADDERRADAAQRLLDRLVEELRTELKVNYPGADTRDLHAYLFAYDAESDTLTCVVATASAEDELRSLKVTWGKDVIGTAFRRREFFRFTRSQMRYQSGLIENLPRNLECLIAFPVSSLPEVDRVESLKEWPCGVVALATSNSASGLLAVTDENDILALATHIATVWLEGASEIFES